MSLFRRIWLTIIGLTLAAFIGSLLVNTFTARGYLEKQLDIKNKDNATALALAMSQQSDKDPVTMELLLAALFDNGHYQEIRLTDPHGKVIVERQAPAGLDLGAPPWFVALLPIRVSPGVAHISDGWKQYGSISLASNSKFAYRDLWQATLELVGWFVFSGVLAGILGTWLLRLITRPLKQVVAQAEAISERRFVSVAEPTVPELDSVVRAMNGMVVRVKQMFAEEAARLDAMRKRMSHDAVSGLPNREDFLGRLREALESEESAPRGVLLMLRLKDLAAINSQLGHEQTDALIRAVAGVLREICGKQSKWLPARLNGHDFTILAQNQASAGDLAQQVATAILNLRAGKFAQIEELFHVGAVAYERGETVGQLLSGCDQQLARAERQEANTYCVPADNVTGQVAIPGEAWRELILAAIRQGRLKLVDFPVIDVTRNKPLHREGVLRLRIDDAGAWLPAGDFMPFAVRFNLAPAIDLAVSRLALDELKLEVGDLAINLSAETFADYECRSRFIDSLNTRPELCQRLWVEVPVYGVVRHFDAFRELCLNLKLQGCRVGIENFGRKLAEVDKLAGLGVDYVKVDSSFVRGIDQHAGNREFLNGLVRMAHRIGILVIAAGVENQRELDSLAALGFDGATGPGVRRAE